MDSTVCCNGRYEYGNSFLPFYIRELGVTNPDELEHWSGIVFSGPFILSFLLTPVWGIAGDRFGKNSLGAQSDIRTCGVTVIGFSANVVQLFIFGWYRVGSAVLLHHPCARFFRNSQRKIRMFL
ncbi:MAG: hypothetical protein R3A12_04995 [Ignavibacteria bacterium]